MSSASSDKVLFNRSEAASTHEEIWDDTALIRIYEETKQRTYKAMQKDGTAGSSKGAQGEEKAPKTWKQGDLCLAPYEDGKWYAAKILSIDKKAKKCKVNYTEYGDEIADIEFDKLLTARAMAPWKSARARGVPFADRSQNKRQRLAKHSTGAGRARATSQPVVLKTTFFDKKLQQKRPSLSPHKRHDVKRQRVAEGSVPTTATTPRTPTTPSENDVEELTKQATFRATLYLAKFGKNTVVKQKAVFATKTTVHTSESDPNAELEESATALKCYLDAISMHVVPEQNALREDDVEYEEAQGADEEQVEESMESESASGSKAESGTDRQPKDRFPIPTVCPPPPPGLFGKIPKAASQNEALTNMLMSWYMSGYHTGYYQGMADAKASKPPRNGQK